MKKRADTTLRPGLKMDWALPGLISVKWPGTRPSYGPARYGPAWPTIVPTLSDIRLLGCYINIYMYNLR